MFNIFNIFSKKKKVGIESLHIKYELEHAFGDFYNYVDLLNMTKERYTALLQCEIFVNMPFTREYMDNWLVEMSKCIENKQWQKAAMYIYEIDVRKQLMYHPDNFYELLANFFILKKEDPSIYDEVVLKEKIEILKKKNSLFNILLSIYLEKCRNLTQDSITSLLDYLVKVREVEKEAKADFITLRSASEKSLASLTPKKI